MTPGDLELASIRRRGGALLIDVVRLGTVFLAIAIAVDRQRDFFIRLRDTYEPGEAPAVVQQQVVLIVGLLLLNYFPLLWAATGQTLGKMLTGIRIVTTGGGRISLPRAYLRFVGFVVDTLLLSIGHWVARMHPRRQTLHDLLAGTIVVRQAPAALRPSPPNLPQTAWTPDRAAIQPDVGGAPASPAPIACPTCGQELPGDAAFCGRCGNRLR